MATTEQTLRQPNPPENPRATINTRLGAWSKQSGILLILLLAAIVRFYGLGFGLPHTNARFGDETIVLDVASTISTGDLNPHFFHYPSLYLYLMAILLKFYSAICVTIGRWPSVSTLWDLWGTNPSELYLLDRGLSATFGVASIGVLYCLVGRVWNQRAALLSSFLLSVAFLHARDSHFGTVDVASTFFLLLACFTLVRAEQIPGDKAFVLAGALGGMAISTKYGAVVIVASALAMVGLSPRTRANVFRYLSIYMVSLVVGFLLTTPYSVLDATAFWRDVEFEREHLQQHFDFDLGLGIVYHLAFSLRHGVGLPILLFAGAGTIAWLRKDWRTCVGTLACALSYYIIAGLGRAVFVRYMVPMVPFLCLSAGISVEALFSELQNRVKSLPRAMLALAALAIALPSIDSLYNFDRLMALEDNRLIVERWLREHVASGKTILQPSYYSEVQLPPAPEMLARSVKEPISEHYRISFEALKRHVQSTGWGLDQWGWSKKHNGLFLGAVHMPYRVVSAKIKAETLPDVIVVPQSFFRLEARDVAAIRPLLENYSIAASFPTGNDNPENYDQLDAVFVPYRSFSGVTRPGPSYQVYVRK